jgi:hypothetical protein
MKCLGCGATVREFRLTSGKGVDEAQRVSDCRCKFLQLHDREASNLEGIEGDVVMNRNNLHSQL